jgi:hypothetical protein
VQVIGSLKRKLVFPLCSKKPMPASPGYYRSLSPVHAIGGGNIYAIAHRQEVRAERPGADGKLISSILGEEWQQPYLGQRTSWKTSGVFYDEDGRLERVFWKGKEAKAIWRRLN